MCVVCPTVTALDSHSYRQEIERIQHFAKRIHIDLMDEEFTGVKSVGLEQVWGPEGAEVDLHVMYKNPGLYIDTILAINPSLVIFHAEAEGDLPVFVSRLQTAGIRVGVAFLQDTAIEDYHNLVSLVDHALIFSGKLGHHGGTTDLGLLAKVAELKSINQSIEISWDGGINDDNAVELVEGGVQVLNVGGYIQHAQDPEANYQKLVELISR